MGAGQKPADPIQFTEDFLRFLAWIDGQIHRQTNEAIKKTMIRYQTIIACGGYLGERAKEMLHTTWFDVVNKTEGQVYQFKTKTKRELVFSESFIKIVNRNYLLINPDMLHHLILPKKDNPMQPISTDQFNTYFVRQVKKSKVVDVYDKTDNPMGLRISTHTLRKTHMLMMWTLLGADERATSTLAKWMNYESTKQVYDYIGVSSKDIKAAALKLP